MFVSALPNSKEHQPLLHLTLLSENHTFTLQVALEVADTNRDTVSGGLYLVIKNL